MLCVTIENMMYSYLQEGPEKDYFNLITGKKAEQAENSKISFSIWKKRKTAGPWRWHKSNHRKQLIRVLLLKQFIRVVFDTSV